jgi:acyl carrier protein
MSETEIFIKIKTIIHHTFQTNYPIQMTSTADDVDQWDSITHIELITNVEKEFGIRFALGELQELKNVGEMVTLVGRKLN